MVAKSFMRHNIEPNEEEQLDGVEDLERKSLSSKEIRKLQDQQKKKQPSPPKRKLILTGKRKKKASRRKRGQQHLGNKVHLASSQMPYKRSKETSHTPGR